MTARQTRVRDLPAGSLPALVTPMRDDGQIDWKTFCALLDWHLESGSDGVVVAGSTGEGASLSASERIKMITAAVERAGTQLPVIVGCAATGTTSAIQQALEARDAGADAVLVPAPAYSRPTQEGLRAHFQSIAEAADVPILLYNVPGRTSVDIETETVLRLAQTPNIIGLKDVTGDIGRAVRLLATAPEGFTLYSGDDASAAALMLLGARGVISVAANIAPRSLSNLCRAALCGDINETRRLARTLAPLFDALGVTSNPIPVKYALARRNLAGPSLRLPLTPLPAHLHPLINDVLAALPRQGSEI